MQRMDSFEKTLMLGKIEGWRRRGWQRMRSLNGISNSMDMRWWTGRPGVLQSMGLQRVGHDWATELNWTYCQTISNWYSKLKHLLFQFMFTPYVSHTDFCSHRSPKAYVTVKKFHMFLTIHILFILSPALNWNVCSLLDIFFFYLGFNDSRCSWSFNHLSSMFLHFHDLNKLAWSNSSGTFLKIQLINMLSSYSTSEISKTYQLKPFSVCFLLKSKVEH